MDAGYREGGKGMSIPNCPQCGAKMVRWGKYDPLSNFTIFTCPKNCEGPQSVMVKDAVNPE